MILAKATGPSPVEAHPHQFIDVHVNIILTDSNIQEAVFTLVNDPMTSSLMVRSFDSDRDNIIDEEETARLYALVMEKKKNQNYHLKISFRSSPLPVAELQRFKAFMKNDKLVYRFSLPLNISLNDAPSSLAIRMCDVSNFTYYKHKYISVTGGDSIPFDITGSNSHSFLFRLSHHRGSKKEPVRKFDTSARGEEKIDMLACNKQNMRLEEMRGPLIYKYIRVQIMQIQYYLHRELTGLAGKISSSASAKMILLSLLIALIYGIVHATGPGHGKIIAMSYFLSEKSRVRHGIGFGFLFSFIHVTSAVLAVTGLLALVKYTTLALKGASMAENVDNYGQIVSVVSYSGVFILGGVLTWLRIKEIINQKKEGNEEEITSPVKGRRALFSMAFTMGIIPCPGTTVLLLFAMSLNLFLYGLLLAYSMAVGMGLTISFFGIIAILIRSRGISLFNEKSRRGLVVRRIFEVGGAVLVMFLGGTLLLLSL